MKCENAILLVEKLVDGEASADEKALVEQHVAGCTDCRTHYAFVKALASASEKIELPPAPPQAYWDHLPSRIVARLSEEESPGFWQRLFAPSVLRWGALAAMLTVVVAVGMNVLREGDLAVEAPALQDFRQGNKAEIVEELEAPDEKVEVLEPPAEPAVARRPAAAPETAPDPRLEREQARSKESDSEKLSETIAPASRARAPRDAADALVSSPPAEPKATSETSGVERAARPQVMENVTVIAEPMRSLALGESRADPAELEYQELRGGARPGNAGRRGLTISVEDCEPWRAYLERYPDGSRASDARYELARCALGRYEAAPSDAGREVALRDVNAFLGDEPEGTRAEEISERAASLRQR